jgi:hypothetical protein
MQVPLGNTGRINQSIHDSINTWIVVMEVILPAR